MLILAVSLPLCILGNTGTLKVERPKVDEVRSESSHQGIPY